jgi:hypothetical protein
MGVGVTFNPNGSVIELTVSHNNPQYLVVLYLVLDVTSSIGMLLNKTKLDIFIPKRSPVISISMYADRATQ